MAKKVFKKRPTKLTKAERLFAGQYLKKGGVEKYKRILRARWWMGRNVKFRR